ncbi:MAG: DUF4333 domain-containing protein [Chloroflexota bacterium]
MKRSHQAFPALIFTIAAVALAGCGGSLTVTRYIDVDRLESTLADGLTEQTGATIESVECPEEIAMEAGNEFECTATDDQGNTGIVTVTQDDDQGSITWKLEP